MRHGKQNQCEDLTMCGIAGIVSIKADPIGQLDRQLEVMNRLIQHRGPDGQGIWADHNGIAGLAHRRLSIIDLSSTGAQPMIADNGTVISFNGEVYNYIELQQKLRDRWQFKSRSDTETVLAAYDRYGDDFLVQLRGMFAFALWDQRNMPPALRARSLWHQAVLLRHHRG